MFQTCSKIILETWSAKQELAFFDEEHGEKSKNKIRIRPWQQWDSRERKHFFKETKYTTLQPTKIEY